MPAKKDKKSKIIKGSFRPCREKKTSQICETKKIPNPPDCLDELALKEWHRISPQLYEAGLLSDLDRAGFAAYCQSYSRYIQAEIALEGQPLVVAGVTGAMVKNPLISISLMAADNMLKFGKMYGLTPASRTRVTPKGKKKKDPWTDF